MRILIPQLKRVLADELSAFAVAGAGERLVLETSPGQRKDRDAAGVQQQIVSSRQQRATNGGLKPESFGDSTKAQVNNLTLRNVTFEPCIRASGEKNGSQMYVLAGVNNFLWDGGAIASSNGSCIRWSNDGSSKDRKPPTGEIRKVAGCGTSRDKFVNGSNGKLNYKGLGNTMNGKPV